MKANQDVLNHQTELIVLMEKNLRQKLAYVPSKQHIMSAIDIGSTLVVNSGMPSDTFNTAYGGTIDLKTAEQVYNYYTSLKFPMAWWIGPSSQHVKTGMILQQAGFHLNEHDVGMVCDLRNITAHDCAEQLLEIKTCTDATSLNDFGEVLASIFSPVDESVKTFYRQLAQLNPKEYEQLRLFVGYVNGHAVSTSTLFLTECAGIFDISTCPEQRHRGYGTAMFHHALQEAVGLGYAIAVLQASPDGLNIYKRVGFQRLCDFYVWGI